MNKEEVDDQTVILPHRIEYREIQQNKTIMHIVIKSASRSFIVNPLKSTVESILPGHIHYYYLVSFLWI